MKSCTKCGEQKAAGEFHRDRRNPSGRYAWCKACVREKRRAYYATNAEDEKAGMRAWYAANLTSEQSRKRAARREKHGWAPGESDRADAELSRVTACGCCGSRDPRRVTGWVADHDHRTGLFRAHVCNPCNIMIGFMENHAGTIEMSAQVRAYLAKYARAAAA